MSKPKLINVGTAENPRWIRKDLVWGNTYQTDEDHTAEKIASGSILPSETHTNSSLVKTKTPDGI